MHPASRSPNRAFTLIELIVTLLILAALATIAVVGYNEVTARAAAGAAQANLRNAANVLTAADALDPTPTFTRQQVIAAFEAAGVDVVDAGVSAAGWTAHGATYSPSAPGDLAIGFADAQGRAAGDAGGAQVILMTGDGHATYAAIVRAAAANVAVQKLPAGQTPAGLTSPEAPDAPDEPAEPQDALIMEADFTELRGFACSKTVTLPLSGYSALDVDWGDGTTATAASSDPASTRHTYAADIQTPVITVRGQFAKLDINTGNASCWLRGIPMWGDATNASTLSFRGSVNLTHVAEIPSTITSLREAFLSSEFSSDISGWDTSNVTDMSGTFNKARLFDADLSGWDTSKVTTMNSAFYGARSFNADLSSWDTSAVTDMAWMFTNATAFNRDLSEWDVSGVTTMAYMFSGADSFNQDLSGWTFRAPYVEHASFSTSSAWTLPKPSFPN